MGYWRLIVVIGLAHLSIQSIATTRLDLIASYLPYRVLKKLKILYFLPLLKFFQLEFVLKFTAAIDFCPNGIRLEPSIDCLLAAIVLK